MGKKAKVPIGERFNHLVISGEGEQVSGRRMFRCQCDCGAIKTIRMDSVMSGHTKSCGCILDNSIHGMSGDSEYICWQKIKQRCLDSNHKMYSKYGGRGISVCERWLKFENFYSDMGRRPGPGYSIDRIDNDGDYCKGNCRWATWKQQGRNRGTNRFLDIDGKKMIAIEWCEKTGANYNTVCSRLRRGWSDRDALFGR